MKIGIDARFLQSARRGQGQYVYYLIKELLALGGEDEYVAFYNSFKVGALAFETSTPRLKQVWCTVPGTLLRASWSGLSFPPVEALIGGIDLFHNPTNFSFTHYAPIPSRAPMVATFNGMADPSTIWSAYDENRIDGWFRHVADTASMVIAVSKMVKDDLQRRVRIPDERIRIIPYGVSDEFRPISDQTELEKILSRYNVFGKRYLLYVGAAEPNKNLSTLVEAFSEISKRPGLDDVCLVMAGALDAFYHRLIDETRKKIPGKAIFTGYVDHDDLPFLYSGASAFVLPTHVEWFGIPVLEAMACGTPVAASKNTGALDEVGDSVVSFDPADPKAMADSLHEILLNKDLRSSLRQKSLERVKGLSWKRTAGKTFEVYREAYRKRR